MSLCARALSKYWDAPDNTEQVFMLRLVFVPPRYTSDVFRTKTLDLNFKGNSVTLFFILSLNLVTRGSLPLSFSSVWVFNTLSEWMAGQTVTAIAHGIKAATKGGRANKPVNPSINPSENLLWLPMAPPKK